MNMQAKTENKIEMAQGTKFNFGDFLHKQKTQIAAALPKHLTADRMLRIVMTEYRKTPALRNCTPESVIGAVIQCSQLGLEPGNSLGHAYLIPFKKKVGDRWIEECQFMIGYRGMIDLARRSGNIISISPHAVYENDIFEFEYGLNEKLKHIPNRKERGDFICAYVVTQLKGGGHQMSVMFKNEIDKIRQRSKAGDKGPWVSDYEQMAIKTVIRQHFKYLPVSIEVQKIIALDEEADRGEQDNSVIFEGEIINDEDISSKTESLDKKLESKEIDQFIKELDD